MFKPKKTDLNFYFNLIKNQPLINEDKEKELAVKIKNGDENALNELILSNLRLVVKIVYDYRKSWMDFQDLVQAGNLGLIMAAKKFDPEKGAKFSTYACYYIKQQMNIFCIKNKFKTHVPVMTFHSAREAIKAHKEGKEHNFKTSKNSIKNIEEAKEIIYGTNLSLDIVTPISNINEDAEDSLYDILGKYIETADKIASSNNNEELLSILNKIVDELLDPKERMAIIHYFGLKGETSKNLYEIGKLFGISHEMVRIILKDTLIKLKIEMERTESKWL